VFFDIVYRNLFVLSVGMMTVFSFLMGAFYFPAILKYQPENDFGRYAKVHAAKGSFVSYHCQTGAANIFYAQQVPIAIWSHEQLNAILKPNKSLIVITSPFGKGQLDKDHIKYKVIEQRYRYQVSKLTADFLNPASRNRVCDTVYLIEAGILSSESSQ